MTERRSTHGGWQWNGLYAVYGLAMIAVVSVVFLIPAGGVSWLVLAGWGLFGASACLGWIPIVAFRRRGRVAKGKSYIHTTQLVTSGLYAIIRHPQFLAGDFLAVAVMCITQHWAAYLAGGIGIATNRWTMIKADRDLVAKFGHIYQEYMHRVPRTSLVLGGFRWLLRHRKKNAGFPQ
ncbi:isoprenylcysteine carboxylmethyltransferase family protein [Candidatus Bipolaricaulota bacterium]|nr:isoprenylcysteine carboxylmethyltransferase family protein [Candidatus Bipolaricaulota bacterium]